MENEVKLTNIDNLLYKRLNYEAQKQGVDLRSLIISIIKKSFGLEKIKEETTVYNDLDKLAGTWTEEDYKTFMKNTEELNKIDSELWK